MIDPVRREDIVGGGAPQPLPQGTVTLVLADIEGSTALWEADRSAMAAAAARADAIIDELVAAHGGTRPIEQGEGDSFVAAFARASDALACAVEIQRRTADSLTRYRMGIHTGEVQVHDDRTYLGPAVNRAARIRDAGHGGQVLLSQTTADLAADLPDDQLPDGTVLVDRGVHGLKGLNRPEHVWELVTSRGGRARPPLRSVSVPSNLGVELTTFVGRVEELEVIGELLDGARAVTLTGAGGSGKTRLAMQLGARRSEWHPGGIWLADLAPAGDEEGLVDAVCDAVGIPPSADAIDRVGRQLGGAPTLLILDNCEHLIDASARVADALLRACPSLTILATSREPLGIDGEVTFRVPSLEPTDAAALFLERARRADPTFSPEDSEREAVDGICARLEGMPLAIELAAARMRTLSLAQIRGGLNDRFRLLVGGARTAVPRHQTLQASVDWSYALLLDVEREVLNRLSVFAGGFSLAAAEEVCSGDGIESHHVLDVLTQLVDKSLVAQDHAGDRFVLTETVRQYAATRLADSGAAPAVRERHYAYVVSITRVGVGREDELRYRRSIDADYDNVRRALQWAADEEDPSLLNRLCSRLYLYWSTSSRVSDGRRWFTEVVAREPDPVRRASSLGRLGLLRWFCGDHEGGRAAQAEAVEVARELGDHKLLLWTLLSSGQVHDTTSSTIDEAIALAEQLGDHEALAWGLWQLGMHEQGWDPAAAEPLFRRSFELAQQHGVAWLERLVHTSAVLRRVSDGEVASLRADLEAVVEVLIAEGDMAFLPTAIASLTILHAKCGDRVAAEQLLERADDLIPNETTPGALGRRTAAHGFLAASAGHWDEAIADFTTALDAHLLPDFDEMTVRGLLAITKAVAGDPDGSLEDVGRAAAIAARLDGYRDAMAGHPLELPIALAHRARGDLVAAEDAARAAIAAAHDRESPAWVRTAPVQTLASIYARTGREEEAARLLGAVRGYSELVGLVPDAGDVAIEDGASELARSTLGDDRFSDLFAAGRAMTWSEAVAYAGRGRGTRGGRPLQGWDSLTPTERQVVDLVVTGEANKDVAARLFMSVATVKTHLTHAYAKLGVTSRAQLIARSAAAPASTPPRP